MKAYVVTSKYKEDHPVEGTDNIEFEIERVTFSKEDAEKKQREILSTKVKGRSVEVDIESFDVDTPALDAALKGVEELRKAYEETSKTINLLVASRKKPKKENKDAQGI